MAEINGSVFPAFNIGADSNPNYSAGFYNLSRGVFVYPPNAATNGEPLNLVSIKTGNTRSKSHRKQETKTQILNSYFDDFFFRFYLVPAQIVLDTFSAVTVDFILYNMHFDDTQAFTAITDDSPNSGITITGQQSGSTFGISALNYVLEAAAAGTPIVDMLFTWDFPVNVNLPVTGNRIIIIPWEIYDKAVEGFEWKTDVLTAYSRETRHSLRELPRRSFSLSYMLQDEDRLEFERLLSGQNAVYSVGLWWALQYVTQDVFTNQTQIQVNTTDSEFRTNGFALLWASEDQYEIVTITQINAGSVDVSFPITANYSNAKLIPVEPAYVKDVKLKEFGDNLSAYNVNFISPQTLPLEAAGSFTQYKGADVLTDRSVVSKSIASQIVRARVFADNGIGPVKPFVKEDRYKVQIKQEWSTQSAAAFRALKEWLYSRRGKQVSFWKPTWKNDFQIAEDLVDVNTHVDVKFNEWPVPFDIQIAAKDGTVYYREITSSTLTLGNSRLVFTPAIGTTYTVDEIESISLMRKMRQSADSVNIAHSDGGLSKTSVGVVDV